MKIKGLQKTTLIDYPGKVACTIFLYGCNFRCGFCHNPELVVKENMQGFLEGDVLDFLEKRKKYLEGVCITGGEPLLTLDVNFLKKIKGIGYAVKIDTNGSCPNELLNAITENLVDFIAMDIKSSKEKYLEVCNLPENFNFSKIEESIKMIMESSLNYEFRTTVVKRFHTKEEFRKMFEWLKTIFGERKIKRFCIQAFRNSGKLIDESFYDDCVSDELLEELRKIAESYCEEVIVRK
jgi:pyruvate formate lyase activating enzyme